MFTFMFTQRDVGDGGGIASIRNMTMNNCLVCNNTCNEGMPFAGYTLRVLSFARFYYVLVSVYGIQAHYVSIEGSGGGIYTHSMFGYISNSEILHNFANRTLYS